MNLKTIADAEIKTLEDFVALRKNTQEILTKAGKELLESFFKDLFLIHPELEQFSFQGYEVYFADGDPTYYTTDGFSYQLFGKDEEDTYNLEENTTLGANITKATNLIESLGESIRDIYGDHKRFTITRNGILVESYTKHD